MNKKTLEDIDVVGKRVLVRVDYNVPLHPTTGAISDDTRLRATLPTLRYLIERGARLVLCSHLGRPDGKVVEELRLAPVAERLSQLLDVPVAMAPDCVGPEVEAMAQALPAGGVLLLENLRFHPDEEENDPAFAQGLARLGQVFVNDAFGMAHRAHASTVGVAQLLPAVAGFLMQKELVFLGEALTQPERPFVALVGGAKVSDKVRVLENLLHKVDLLLIGGGMANTFLSAQGQIVGQSSVEEESLDFARRVLAAAGEMRIRVSLPTDVVVGERFEASAQGQTVLVDHVPAQAYIMDIGAETIESFSEVLRRARTVIWNGPMGVFEFPAFRHGTEAMASMLAEVTQKGATTVIGGGSTAEAVEEMGLVEEMSHVSTGGGASLRFLEGRPLPGVEALLDKEA